MPLATLTGRTHLNRVESHCKAVSRRTDKDPMDPWRKGRRYSEGPGEELMGPAQWPKRRRGGGSMTKRFESSMWRVWGGRGSVPLWIDVRWVKGVYGGSGGEGGERVERLIEKAERRLKLIERMSTGRRAGGESTALVNERVCLGECVRERRSMSRHIFPALRQSVCWPLGAARAAC